MDAKLTSQERLKDLRQERGLTLEQLEEATGLSKAALGRYEGDEPKDISLYALVKLAQFYGVTTDYLLALSEQKNHPDAEIIDLHLSDEMLDILRSGKLNNRLLCEIVAHEYFHRLLLDIEIYVDRIASSRIDNLNAYVAAARAKVLTGQEWESSEKEELYLRTVEAAYIQEDKYFTHTVHEDMDIIIADIREAHKKDVTTADNDTLAAKLEQDVDEAMQFEGSEQERVLRIFCSQLSIPRNKLTQEESAGMIGALKKSKRLWDAQNKRGKNSTYRKGKQKKKS